MTQWYYALRYASAGLLTVMPPTAGNGGWTSVAWPLPTESSRKRSRWVGRAEAAWCTAGV